MKELTIQEKAKAYDEAIEKARKLYNSEETSADVEIACENIFSELKESEDERIRKRIITLVNAHCQGMYKTDCLAWLEKQGEQNLVIEMKSAEESLGIDSDTYNEIVDECIYGEQKPADKVEHKFEIGDWVVFNNKHQSIYQVEKIEDGYYILRHTHGGTFRICVLHNESLRLWTIQDAKDGDVLCCESGWTCIFKTLVNDETFSSYCFMDSDKWFYETGSECHTLKEEFIKAYNGKIYPATKEQRDLLFQKMKEAGYEWDAEKKELKKQEIAEIPFGAKDSELQEATYNIPKGFYAEIDSDKVVIKKGRQKPTWSEEDESILQAIWDEILANKHNAEEYEWKTYDKFLYWLKSLRPQNQWKPSDEQMQQLNIVSTGKGWFDKRPLREMYEQLKKLKGE